MFVCVRKCFFRGRVWAQGETLVPSPGEAVPKHFVPKAQYKPAPQKPVAPDPKTLHELAGKSAANEKAAGGLTAAAAGAGPVNAEGQAAGQQGQDSTPDFLK